MKMKTSGKAVGIPFGLTLGTLTSLVVSVLGAAISAWLISSEKIGQGGIGYAAIIILVLAAISGAMVSTMLTKRLRLQVCMLSGVIYYLVLLGITALFFGGQYQGMVASAVVILVGCAIVAFLPAKSGQYKMKRKKAYR